MDEKIQPHAAGRDGAPDRPGDDPTPARDSAEYGPFIPGTGIVQQLQPGGEVITVAEGVPSSHPRIVNQANHTAPATRPSEVTPTAMGFRVRFCTWCKQIDIRGPRRDTDVFALIVVGKNILASWNGKTMIVQDGICEPCAKALKDGRVIDGSTTL